MHPALRELDQPGKLVPARPGPLRSRALPLARCLCLALILVFGSRPASARVTLEDFYVGNDNQCLPHPKLQVTSEHAGDAGTFVDSHIQMPAILAVLNYELTTNTWSTLTNPDQILPRPTSAWIQQYILGILNDPALTMIYTGKQSLLAHSSGLQTLDINTILVNQEGMYDKGAPLPFYTIGRHVIHELGHVFQQRNWTPFHLGMSSVFGDKETLPLELEAELPPDNFTPDQIARVAKHLKDARSIEGTWSSNFGDVTFQYDPSTPFTGDKPVSVSGYWYQDNDQNRKGTLTGGRYDPISGKLDSFRYSLEGDSGTAYFQLSCGGQNMRGACGAPWNCWRDLPFDKQ